MPIENKKQIFLIIFAVLAGILAVFLASNYVSNSIQRKTQELHDSYEQQEKQMATEMMQRSDQQMGALREEITRVRQEQQQAMQKATEAMKAQQQAALQSANSQPMTRKAPTSMLTAKTPAGKRAVTVLIDSLNAVGGLLNAGDFVDVIAHLDVPEDGVDKKKPVTAMLFQNLQVLAINTNLDNPGAYDQQQSAQSLKITFAVDPQEAGLLSFANKNGKLELALRSPNENDKQMVKSSTWKTLADYVLQNQGEAFDVPSDGVSDDTAATTGKPAADAKPYIQIFRGGKEL